MQIALPRNKYSPRHLSLALNMLLVTELGRKDPFCYSASDPEDIPPELGQTMRLVRIEKLFGLKGVRSMLCI